MNTRVAGSLRPKNQEDFEILRRVDHAISIAEAMNEPLWLGDRYHRTIYVNPVYEKTSGYSLAECIGKPSDFCFDEKSKQTIAEHHKLRKEGMASQYEATMVSKSGEKIPLLISGAPTATGGTIGIFINLSKVKKLEEKSRITEQIVKNSAEAIVVMDKDHKIQLWNSGASKIFGYKESEVLGKKLSTLVVPKDLAEENRKIVQEVEEKNILRNFETKRLIKSGDRIDVSLSISKVTDKSTGYKGYLVIYQDITDRKRINTELQKRFEAIQDAYKELGLQKRQADYLYEIMDLATEKGPIERLGKLIVSASCMLTKCDAAVLRLKEKNRKYLKLLSCLGVSSKWLDKDKIAFQNSLAEDAYRTGRPIIIQDIDASTKHRGVKLVKEHNFKALILIPLVLEGELIGSLSLYATDPGKFRLIETEFLQRFGKQCTLALAIKRK